MITAKDKEFLKYATNQDTGKLVSARLTRAQLEKNGWLEYVKTRYSDISSEKLFLREAIYRIFHDIETRPVCKICGKPVSFKDSAYPTYCGPKCSNKDPEILVKNKAGVSKTLKKRYAEDGENYKARRAKTIKERYGVETSSPFGVKGFQDKAKATIEERYGVKNILQLEKYHIKSLEVQRNNSVQLWKDRGLDIEYTDNDTIIIHNGCKIHGDIELPLGMFNNRTKPERMATSTVCPICNPLNSFSGPEQLIKDFLTELNVKFVCNDRSVISPLELDFYLPEHKLAIEFNGIYFHRDSPDKPREYHKIKSELCEKLGIQLLHIWEYDWITNRDLVCSIIKSKLGLTECKIYARDCIIKEVTPSTAKEFLMKHHLQGVVNAKYKFGLFYNDELVSLMTFGNLRHITGQKHNKTACELYRYCSKMNTSIVGGASKLFKHAVEKLKSDGLTSILTFAKRDFSNGNLYKTLGFTFNDYTAPNYLWVNRYGETVSRYAVQKHKIAKTEEDKAMTEDQIMSSRGYYKCYDSGNLKFTYTIPND